MKEVNKKLPMIVNGNPYIGPNTVLSYFKDVLRSEYYEKLKEGYKEMSQTNLSLSEIGFEEDVMDLYEYEAKLGCEIL